MKSAKNFSIVLLNTCLLLVALEIVCWVFPSLNIPQYFAHVGLEKHNSLIRDLDLSYLKNIQPRRFERKDVDRSAQFPQGYFTVERQEGNEGKGYILLTPENTVNSVVRVKKDGKVIYDVNYNIDRYSRRSVPANKESNRKFIMTLGCSNTFGEGLKDEMSYPAMLSKRLVDTNVYNLGFHGYNIASDLYELREVDNHPKYKGISGDYGIAIYLLLDFHIMRFVGSTLMYRSGWGHWSPKFSFVDDNKKLLYEGNMNTATPWLTKFLTIISFSKLLKALGVNLPPISDRDLKAFAQAIVEVRQILKEKYNVENLIVVSSFNNKGSLTRNLLEKLHDRGVTVFDYSSVNPGIIFRGAGSIQYDGHPSGVANRFLVDLLERDLKKVGI